MNPLGNFQQISCKAQTCGAHTCLSGPCSYCILYTSDIWVPECGKEHWLHQPFPCARNELHCKTQVNFSTYVYRFLCPLLPVPLFGTLSCIAYNPYHKHHLVSSDYEGSVCVWDTNIGCRTALHQVCVYPSPYPVYLCYTEQGCIQSGGRTGIPPPSWISPPPPPTPQIFKWVYP